MKKHYDIIDGQLLPSSDENSKILVFIAPDEAERRDLTDRYKIDPHTLRSALDPDELARVEYEPDQVAIIFKRPKHYSPDDDFLFRVSSVGLFLLQDRLIAVIDEDIGFFDPGKDVSHIQSGLHGLMIRLIARSVSQFLGHIRAISLIVDDLQEKLDSSMNNRHLLHLFKLGQSMTYYLSATSSNGILIERLKATADRIGFAPKTVALLEDLHVDNTQCYQQAKIFSDIMSSMSDARASVVNNNLNLLMKRLTVLSTLFMPLNVIAGVFGMSEYTEFTRNYLSWPAAYGLFALGLVGVSFLTYWLLHRTGLD